MDEQHAETDSNTVQARLRESQNLILAQSKAMKQSEKLLKKLQAKLDKIEGKAPEGPTSAPGQDPLDQLAQGLQIALRGTAPSTNNAAASTPWGPNRKIDGIVTACTKWGGETTSGKAYIQRLTDLATDAGLKPAMNASHGEVENLDHQSTTDRAKLKGVEALFLLLTSTICNCHG